MFEYLEIPKFECEKCSYTTKVQSKLNNHIQVAHEGVKKFSCEKCGKAFGYQYNLKLHIERFHEGKGRNLQCEKCSFAAYNQYMLNQHIQGRTKAFHQYEFSLHKLSKSYPFLIHFRFN